MLATSTGAWFVVGEVSLLCMGLSLASWWPVDDEAEWGALAATIVCCLPGFVGLRVISSVPHVGFCVPGVVVSGGLANL